MGSRGIECFGIPSWKSVYTSHMRFICLLATIGCGASHATRARGLSVVAVPKVRDPIESTGVLARDGHGPGQHDQRRKLMSKMERYQQGKGSQIAARTSTEHVRGDAAEIATCPERDVAQHWSGQEATVGAVKDWERAMTRERPPPTQGTDCDPRKGAACGQRPRRPRATERATQLAFRTDYG